MKETKRFFCTYTDENFIPRALALWTSIKDHHKDFTLYVCLMTKKAVEVSKKIKLKNIKFSSVNDLEKELPILKKIKKQRSKIEYYFTCTPALIEFLLKKHNLPYLEYIDADMFFFRNSNYILKKIKNSSVGMTPHRFARTKQVHQIYGKFNVGWLFFRNNKDGLKCLRWWKQNCLRWCFDRVEKDKYADQKYLDRFFQVCKKIKVLSMPGFNEAPWNVVPERIKKINTTVFVGNYPLVLYHFSGLHKICGRIFDPTWSDYELKPNDKIIDFIYIPYLCAMKKWEKKVQKIIKKYTFLRKISPLYELKESRSHLSFWNEIRKKVSKKNYIYLPPAFLIRFKFWLQSLPMFMPSRQSKSGDVSPKS